MSCVKVEAGVEAEEITYIYAFRRETALHHPSFIKTTLDISRVSGNLLGTKDGFPNTSQVDEVRTSIYSSSILLMGGSDNPSQIFNLNNKIFNLCKLG